MFTVSAEPVTACLDALASVLTADMTLMALVTGVYGHLSEAERTDYPYVVIGQTTVSGDAGAMGRAGDLVTVQIDGWSNAKGPGAIEAIGSRIYRLLERRSGFSVPGFTVIDGSLHRAFGDYFDEPDEDKPGSRLYRMVQRWTVEIHESI